MSLDKPQLIKNIDKILRLLLFALIVIIPFSIAGIEIFVCILIGLWVIKRSVIIIETRKFDSWSIVSGFKPKNSLVNTPIGFFLLVCFLSIASSLYFLNSLESFFTKTLEGILLFFIIIEILNNKKDLKVVFLLFVFSAFIVSIDGIIQYFFTGKDLFCGRVITRGGATGPLHHANDLGGYMIIPIFLSIAIGITYKIKSNITKIFFKALPIVFCLLLLLTKSRGALFGTFSGVLFFLFYARRKFFIYIVVTLLVFTVFGIVYMHNTNSLLDYFRLDSQSICNTAFSRAEIWADTLNIIKDKPIFGHGINTYMRTLQKYRSMPWQQPYYAHNCYLQMASEIGLVGVVFFLWIIIVVFRKGISIFKTNIEAYKFYILLLLSGLFGFLVHSFVDTNLYSLQLNTLFWYVLALVVSLIGLKPTLKQ